jgi:glycosyltransferase involved in cell wall biosynthesis
LGIDRELIKAMQSERSEASQAAPVQTSERPKVTAVMPCLNEEKTVGVCVEKAFQSFRAMGIRGEVIVADNGSTDRSIEIAAALGARIVRQEIRGYGAALGKGIAAARGDVIVMGDADDTYDWSSIGAFVHKINEGYDLVMGNRFKGGIMPGAMPLLHRYLGNPVLSAISRVAFGVPVSDFHCGMRAFTREAFERMRTQASGMEFATEMIASAAIQHLRICEIPTTLHPDKRDRPPHLRSFRDGWRHLRFILTFAPDYLYFAPGLVMLGLGTALLALLAGGPIDVYGHRLGIHFVALGAMLALIGFNVLNLGILAKAIIARRFTGMRSRVVRLLTGRFSLELGLIVGGVLFLSGVGVDYWILQKWWTTGQGPMEDTVHLSFVATTSAVLGLNLAFNSFLLALLVSTDADAR